MYSGLYSGISVLVVEVSGSPILDPHFSQYLMFGLAVAPQFLHCLPVLGSLDLKES